MTNQNLHVLNSASFEPMKYPLDPWTACVPFRLPNTHFFFFFFAHTQWIVLGSDENHYTNFAVPVFISSSPAVIWDKEMDTWQALLPPEKEMNNNPVSSNCASAKRTFPDGTLDMQHTCTHTHTDIHTERDICLSIYLYIHTCMHT